MIARIWRATATTEGAEAYRRHFTQAVIPELSGIEGHRGAYLLNRDRDGQVEIEVITLWASMDAVRDFAAPDVDAAVVEPEAQKVLTAFDPTVTHHTVITETATTTP
ncbi:antibiotic biosynthesis monooxygenase [Sphaerisporangium sp. NPDC005289]|uniref:Antibiotic biosynthesis monooxygenase family protein n=1 Tax=Sphaerisporangium rhizosphaerae TaxID=2269375 RepID=A0ABW2PBF2_9ACTN